MRYKLVAIDLDDTLLADDLSISAQTIDVIHEAVAKGVIVTLATGRMYKSAVKYAEQINLNVPIITYQGAYIKNVLDGKELYKRFVSYDYSVDILKRLKEMNKMIQVYINDELYVQKDNLYIKDYVKITQVNYHVVDDLLEIIDNSSLPFKIIAIDSPNQILIMLKEFKELYKDKLNVNTSKPNFLEFSNIEASKGQAIKYLASRRDISMEEVIAIGDSYNDYDMIKMAGLGVAMENSHPKIKEIANYVTKTNNDHGVWEVFKKFIL
ncbi:MAG: Cof-type HAD-IIB family hydrolase [Vulcanibacillus sp.]